MATQDQFLKIEPDHEIVFEGPFTEIVNSTLVLTNTDKESKVCFKVKTTAPKRYCVRPNNGVLEPLGSAEVLVMRQAYEPEEQEIKATKHKFMVQSMIVTDPDQLEHMDQIWKDSTKVIAAKLKCVFKNPGMEPMLIKNAVKISPLQNFNTPDSTAISDSITSLSEPLLVTAKSSETDKNEEIEKLKKENIVLQDERARLRSIAMKKSTEPINRPIITETKQVAVPPFQQPFVIASMAICFIIGIILTKLMF